MKKIITYGTFDLFHEGHRRLLERAKKLGDYLIVGITAKEFDITRGKLNVQDDLLTRIKNVQETGLADEILIEEYFGQKIDDIQKLNIDIFTVGSDWKGHFDYLKDYCDVVYLERTKGISSTQIRNEKAIRLGIYGAELIVERFLNEARFVSGIEPVAITYDEKRHIDNIKNKYPNIEIYDNNLFWENIDAVYIATPPAQQWEIINKALEKGKHILCEFPIILSEDKLTWLLSELENKSLTFLLGLKTAYCPAFKKLISIARSGLVGKILCIDANFTQINEQCLDEQIHIASGGSVNALASYPLLVISKLLGTNATDINFISKYIQDDIDVFTKMIIYYKDAIGTANVAINAKSEGNLVITGERGYIYVPAPWWKTEYFEVRFENPSNNLRYFYKFDGEGLRYEIAEFAKSIKEKKNSLCITNNELNFIASKINIFKNNHKNIKL